MYGIYAHRNRSSVASMPSGLPLDQDLVWLYFPLDQGEKVQAVWGYYARGSSSNYNFVASVLCNCRQACLIVLQINTSYGKTYNFGEHVDYAHRTINFVNRGLVKSLLYDDPNPEEPILGIGTSCYTRKLPSDEPRSLSFIHYPFHIHGISFRRHSMYHSQASLEGVEHVTCFCREQNRYPRAYIGVLLEYQDKRRAALGECRIGVSETVEISAPTMLYLRPVRGASFYSCVAFTSEAKEGLLTKWERRPMGGSLTWWFGVGVIEIVHSLF